MCWDPSEEPGHLGVAICTFIAGMGDQTDRLAHFGGHGKELVGWFARLSRHRDECLAALRATLLFFYMLNRLIGLFFQHDQRALGFGHSA